MKLFRKIELALRFLSEYGKSPLEIEIERTQSALRRYQSQLIEMTDDEDEDNYIMAYYHLSNKIKRVETRLKQLRVKRGNNSCR
jgi:hypothetical protein